jgi:hypothetical protein
VEPDVLHNQQLNEFAVYALKALIVNLLATKGLSRLRAGLRAQINPLSPWLCLALVGG